MTVRPRRIAYRGSVVAAGYVFEPRVCGREAARERILDRWAPGSSVYELDGALVLVLARPERVRCHRAPGAPLVDVAGTLFGAPLDDDERAAVDPPPRSIVVVRGGRVLAAPLSRLDQVDPATWLDVRAFRAVDAHHLGVQRPPIAVVDVAIDTSPSVRDAFTELLGEAPDEAGEVLAALREVAASEANEGAPAGASAGSAAGASRARGGGTGTRVGVPRPPGALSRWWSKLVDGLFRSSGMARRVGDKQADYLRRMLEMFDRGDLDEALRHAIPLGGKGGSNAPAASRTVPRPRDSLDISLHQPATSGGLFVGDADFDVIRERYRQAYDRLIARGELDKAAFVLAELLGDELGAIALLERHGELELAAKLAEARELPSGLIVRLWFAAGDLDRAVSIARRTNSFSDAVFRLERVDAERGAALRMIWADHLASTGDYVGAVDAAWRVPEARQLALGWLDHAIAAGGSAGARSLARKLDAAPDTYDALLPGIRDLLESTDDERMYARLELGRQLLEVRDAGDEVRTVARLASRAIVRDAAAAVDGDAAAAIGRLMRLSGDAALRADRPPLPQAGQLSVLVDRAMPFAREVAHSDAGTAAVHDAAPLPNRRTVVALGEAGVRIVAPDGRTVTHFEQPAHHLVVSDNGTRAITLAARGSLWRLGRIDLVGRRADTWCDAALSGFARTFDGDVWYVGQDGAGGAVAGDQVVAIDACAHRFRALWGVNDIGGWLTTLDRDKKTLVFGSHTVGAVDKWLYELPGYTLRQRGPVTMNRPGADNEMWLAMATAFGLPGGDSVAIWNKTHTRTSLLCGPTYTMPLDEPVDFAPSTLIARGRFCIIGGPSADAYHVAVVYTRTMRVVARLTLAGASTASVRYRELVLMVGDDRGRVISVDLRTGRVRRDLRIRA